tara:strand:+ start:565 stop:1779 length:1215 start_codon:yes stop_codon:yes gene_type:complete
MKFQKLPTLLILLGVLTSCAPKDEKIENPYFTTDAEVEEQFGTLFPDNGNYDMEVGLTATDKIAESARLLEFALNSDFQQRQYEKEVERDERGERAKSYVLCRKIKSVNKVNGSKKVFIDWDGCKDTISSDQVITEVRGQETFEIEFKELADGKKVASYIEGQTTPGFNLRLSKKLGRSTDRGYRGDLREDRNVFFRLVDEEKRIYDFTYRATTTHDIQASAVKYTGYNDTGEIQAIAEGKFQVKELSSGELVVTKYIQQRKDSVSLTIKGTRSDIEEKIEDKFYILISNVNLDMGKDDHKADTMMNQPGRTSTIQVQTGTADDGSPTYEDRDVKFCGQFRTNFRLSNMWLTGIPRTMNNKSRGELNFTGEEISVNTDKRKFKRSCMKRTGIAPLLNRDKLYFK